jgi:hypothetical protein
MCQSNFKITLGTLMHLSETVYQFTREREKETLLVLFSAKVG